MANPTKPDIDYSYAGFQQEQQDFPFPGTQLDNDLAELETSIDETIDALADIRRADGALNNGVVTADALAEDLLIGLKTPTIWETTFRYVVLDCVTLDEPGLQGVYRCSVSHESADFSDDLAAGYWELIFLLSPDGLGLAPVAVSGAYADLSGKPTLGTAAAEDVGTFATAAEGAKANTAMQPVTYDSTGKGLNVYETANHDFLPAGTGAIVRTSRAKLRESASFLDFGAVGDGGGVSPTDDSAAITAAQATGLDMEGLGKTYKTTTAPTDFSKIRKAAFKSGSITHVSRDFLRTDTRSVSDNLIYTGWAEDKAYLVGDQIRVWALEKEIHTDGTGRILLFFSDNGGAKYSNGEYLDLAASGRTLWCAGYDAASEVEYLIVRVPSGSTDVAPYTYERWYRTVDLGAGTAEYNGAWTVAAITFPVPSGFSGQPVMVISFTSGHGGSIVVGTSYAAGTAVARSTDGGATWTSHILLTSATAEEPTVKYDPVTQRYYGFMRFGGSGNPRYWYSGVDDLTTIAVHSAPTGTFGPNGMQQSPIPFQIKDGRIHGFGSYRTGTQEGAASDKLTSAFYLDLPVTAGNAWTQATSTIYRLATIPHMEGAGAASAVGIGSVVIHEDKVHLFYGMEGRTGTTTGLNRIADIYQTVIFLTDRGTMFDLRTDLVANGSSGPLRKVAGGRDGFAIYNGDGFGDLPALISGRMNAAWRSASVAIASGVATVSGAGIGRYTHYILDTEGAGATDDIDTCTDTNARKGDIIIFSSFSASRKITFKHGTGNFSCGCDRLLNSALDRIIFEFNGTLWVLIHFSGAPILTYFAGTPETFLSAPIGSICSDITNGVMYMKKTGTGNTGWKLVTQAA